MNDRPSRTALYEAFAHWRAAIARRLTPAEAAREAVTAWLDEHEEHAKHSGDLYDALCGLELRDGAPAVDLTSRRATGVTATPPALAAAMVNHALNVYRARNMGASPRVFEPGCGLAPFIGAVAGERSIAEMVGCDVDPHAIELARRLHPEAAFTVGDALEGDFADFDLVLMNPPYAFGEHKPTAPHLAQFAVHRGPQPDAWHYFVEALVTRWLAPGGIYALVVPDSLLVRETTAIVRDVLLTHAPPSIVSHVGPVFRRPVLRGDQLDTEPAGVSAVVVIGQRGPARQLFVVATPDALAEKIMRRPTPVPLPAVLDDPQRRLFIHTPPPAWELVRAAVGSRTMVGMLLDRERAIGRGIEAGKQSLRTERASGVAEVAAIAGEHVERFRVAPERYFVDHASIPPDKFAVCDPVAPDARVILVRKTDRRLIAAFAPESWSQSGHGEVCLQSVYILRPRDAHAGNVLLGWLNTPLVGFLLSATVTAYKRVLPQITQREVLSLVAPDPARVERDAIQALVAQLCHDAASEPDQALLDAVQDLLISATDLPLTPEAARTASQREGASPQH